jgi:hypothetical protein
MLFALFLVACTASAPAPKETDPDTDGGKAAQAVAEEAKVASEAAAQLVEQVKAAEEPLVNPPAPVEPVAPVAVPAPEKK